MSKSEGFLTILDGFGGQCFSSITAASGEKSLCRCLKMFV